MVHGILKLHGLQGFDTITLVFKRGVCPNEARTSWDDIVSSIMWELKRFSVFINALRVDVHDELMMRVLADYNYHKNHGGNDAVAHWMMNLSPCIRTSVEFLRCRDDWAMLLLTSCTGLCIISNDKMAKVERQLLTGTTSIQSQPQNSRTAYCNIADLCQVDFTMYAMNVDGSLEAQFKGLSDMLHQGVHLIYDAVSTNGKNGSRIVLQNATSTEIAADQGVSQNVTEQFMNSVHDECVCISVYDPMDCK